MKHLPYCYITVKIRPRELEGYECDDDSDNLDKISALIKEDILTLNVLQVDAYANIIISYSSFNNPPCIAYDNFKVLYNDIDITDILTLACTERIKDRMLTEYTIDSLTTPGGGYDNI